MVESTLRPGSGESIIRDNASNQAFDHFDNAGLDRPDWSDPEYTNDDNAYALAWTAYREQASLQLTPDSELQLARLLKATGNLAAARQHFIRAAMLGSTVGTEELAAFPHMLKAAMCDVFPEAHADRGCAPDPSVLRMIRGLSWCETRFDETSRQHELAYELNAAGFADAARATFEMAFVREGFSPERLRERAWIGLQTGLWSHPDGDLCLYDAFNRQFCPVSDLPQVVKLAADDQTFVPGKLDLEEFLTLQMPVFDRDPQSAAKPAQPVVQGGFTGLASMISSLYQALADPVLAQEPTELKLLLQDAWKFILDAAPAISFGYTSASIPAHVTRMLTNNLSHFMRAHHHLGLGPFGSPHMFHAASRCHGRASGAYFADAVNLIEPADRFLPVLGAAVSAVSGATPKAPSYRHLVERVAVLVGHKVELAALETLIHRLLDGRFTMSAMVLIQEVASRSGNANDLLRKASVGLRHAGDSRFALILQRWLAQAHPDDFDTVMELGIQEKVVGEFANAAAAFRRCIALSPGSQLAWREWLAVASEVELPKDVALAVADDPVARELANSALRYRLHLEPLRYLEGRTAHFGSIALQDLAPEIAPELNPPRPPKPSGDRIEVRQLGWRRRSTHFGNIPVLRGVAAARVYCYSSIPIIALRVRLDGRTMVQLRAPGIAVPESIPPQGKYVYNVWLDLSDISQGFHEVEFYFEELTSGYRTHTEIIIVDKPNSKEIDDFSDALVSRDLNRTDGDVEAAINAAPSVVRSAGRVMFPQMPDKVLVVRADQLGDFVASVPAIQRLKALFPDAEFAVLVTSANEMLARSLGLFSQIILADFVYDHSTGRRYLPLPAQIVLRKSLVDADFDLAIDLCPGVDSRPLLRLTGARHLVGFGPREFPWLTFGIETITRDPINGREHLSHAVMVLSLVEALGAALTHHPVTILNPMGRGGLEQFGVGPEDSYLLLHAGARLLIKRWPLSNFLNLARLIIQETTLKVVMLTDEAPAGSDLQLANALESNRFHVTNGQIDFADLEMLIAHCSVFVGNDTGPKHLAALRGAKVVSIHMGQVNWDEWGQEGNGLIVSRRVPCCGCGIEQVEDCGKQLACLTHIRPDEVFEAVRQML